MADAPDLVLRAAARLAKSGGITPPDGKDPVQRRPESVPATAARIPPAPPAAPLERPARDLMASHSAVLSPATLAANGIVLPSAGFSRQVEEFRSIKRQVLAGVSRGSQSADASLSRLIMVTSAAPAEGKTFVSINLALSIAFERDFNVLLIDADAHRQSLIARLGLSADKGWLDVLTDNSVTLADIAIATNVPNLTIIPSGQARPEIPELMSSRKMATMVDNLVNQNPNRLIIFDSLPCLVSTEPTILASMVGQALFVVAAGDTSKDEVESSLRLLDACPAVSLILNKGDPMLIDQFGKYGYGYGYQDNG